MFIISHKLQHSFKSNKEIGSAHDKEQTNRRLIKELNQEELRF